ncbi:phosphodiester glycosidase family protein [Cognatishimia maritima]|uniref:Uncharacterized protein YigE, DUF2233 family n=1 Tax=Cognatishimia maritima TaxID=870908 RepID=A0A1M5SWN6_9RHOB|nr:phosphodiester glycosidase family protein [Cognatishimia maritima]SHH42503.1 Uncharacterized protein YigE, DUF2233 family [Cognatishimia maritima]
MKFLIGLIASFAVWPIAASAVTCNEDAYQGDRYTVCKVDATTEDIRLFLRDDSGNIYGHFDAIAQALPETQTLSFAMNGGMYHPDRRPVGYYVENGNQSQELFPNAGPGNFGLVPNGVFCIRAGRADVIESKRFQKAATACEYATQSGPMLVIDGALHPKFLENSTSKFIRNGVGTSEDGTKVVFVKSENSVTFHTFASFFRDALGLPQALFLDGKISRLYAPSIGRDDPGFWMGPIIGVVE